MFSDFVHLLVIQVSKNAFISHIYHQLDDIVCIKDKCNVWWQTLGPSIRKAKSIYFKTVLLHQRSLLCQSLVFLLLFLLAPSEEIWRVKKKVKCQGFSKVPLQICQSKKVCSGMKRIFELLSLWNKWGLLWSRDLHEGGENTFPLPLQIEYSKADLFALIQR